MRWTTKIKLARKSPEKGDERIIKRFAVFPVKCDNGETVWFESILDFQKWSNWRAMMPGVGPVGVVGWLTYKTLPIEKKWKYAELRVKVEGSQDVGR
jgi:hypothetical protein